eukprot:Em0227g1a
MYSNHAQRRLQEKKKVESEKMFFVVDEDIAREKEKLYQAIGYSKDSKLPDYPKEYVAHNLVFELKRMSVQIRNENGNVSTVVKTVYMSGLSQSGKGKPPSIIEVQEELGNYGGSRVKSRRATVDAMIGMFLLPRDVQLQSISAAAASALEGIKTQTRAGLEHIIGERTFFELDVSLKSPCLLIPEEVLWRGWLSSSATVVVADLGSLRVTTDLTRKVIPDVRTASLEELQEASYDNFNIQISNVQLIVTGSGEDWRKALLSCDITHHLLKPSGLDLVVKKSILPMDTRLPSLLVTGTLPSIALSLSDKKVKQLMKEKKTVSVYPTIRTASVISMLARDPDDSEQEQDEDESEFETASEGDDESEKDDQGKDRAKTCKQTDDGAVARAAKDGGSTNTVEASATTLKILFTINGIAVNYSEYVDGGDIERLKFLLSEMETEVVIKSWDLNVTASIGSAEIQDYFNKSTEPHLLLNSGSNGKKCLNVKYSKNDRQSLHYCSNPQPTEHFVSADMSVVKVEVLKGSLVKLMSMALSIMADITSDDQPSKDIVTISSAKVVDGGPNKHAGSRFFPGERQVYVEARFGGLEVTLGDEHGDILSADMTDQVLQNMANSSADIGRAYLYVSATVQRLMVFVVFKFINRVMHYVDEVMEELKVAKKTLGLSGKTVSPKAHEIQRAKDDENGSKIGLSVSISAPLVVLPLTSTSSSAFVADLGQVEVTNTFLLAEKVAVGQHPSEKFISSGGVPAIVDDMTVDITSVQLFQTSTAMMLKTEDRSHMIIKPIKFHGHVIRKLSGWCSVVPDISIDADLPSLEVQLSPGDYSAILSLMNSLSDGRSTTPSSDKETSDGEGEGDEGQVEAENGEIAIPPTSKDYVKLCMKFQMKEVILHLNEQSDGGHIERLRFLLSEMETEVMMKSWDLNLTASIGSAEIQDYFTKSVEENSQPLLSSGSKERKFLTATYCKNDRQSPHDDASSPPTEQSVDADMSVVKIHLLKRSLVKLMSMGLSIMAEIKSSDQPSYSSVAEEGSTSQNRERKKLQVITVVRQHLPGERLVYVEARFGGLEVTLGDELGYILSADMTDLSTTITVLEEQTLVATSMKNIMITDKDPNSCHPKVVRKIDDSTVVLSAQVKVFKIAEKTNVDINSSDVFVSAIVQRLAVLVVFKFVNRVMHYVDEVMEELKLAKKVLGLSEKSPLKELGVQGAQEEKNGTKIGLSVSISAPLVVLPLTSTSSSAFVADLGQMEVTNTFLLAEKVAVGQHPSEKFISSGGVPAIVDDMTVDITSVQLFQIKDVKGFKIDELGQAITEPIQFHGHVIRKLSDWCSVIPDISIDAELPSLEVQLGPGDYSAILSLMNSLSDGRSTTPSSDKKEGEDDGEKGEIVEEIKQLEAPSDMKGVGASSNVKFLVKFQMKKVILHLNEQSDGGHIERLRFLLSEMETEVAMKSWDMNVTASIGSAEIQDYFTKSANPHILVHSGSHDGKFLITKYCKNNPQSPHYGSSLQPTEQFVKVDMSVMKVQLQQGPLIKLMSMALSIMAEIKPKDQPSSATKDVVTLPKEGAAEKKAVRSGLPGERQVYIEARFGGLEVTLGDEHGDILSADMTDLNTTISMLEEWTMVTASMKNIMLVDVDPNSYHSQIVTKMDDSSTVISTEIKMFNKSSMDVSILDLIVLATVQRLTVFVVFKFVNRVMHYVDEVTKELILAKKALGLSEKKGISKEVGVQGAPEEKNGSKIGLSVSISAPLVVLPLTSTSSSAFVADLGQMEVTNTFLLAEKVAVGQHPSEKFISSGGVPAIVDDMTVDITSVQLYKINNAMMLKTEDRSHMIIKPIQFHGHVMRKLSGWCSVVPDIIVDAELPSLEVQLGPGDYSAILTLMNSLSDGRSTTPSSDKKEREGGGEEGEKEGPESKKLVVSNTKKFLSSDDLKLLIKFHMKEVILHVNNDDDRKIEGLKFLLSEMETEVMMKSWDLNVTASIGSAEIQDYFAQSVDGRYQIL